MCVCTCNWVEMSHFVFRGKGLWVGFGCTGFVATFLPMGLWLWCVCECDCVTESFLATVACLCWLTLTTWSYLAIYTRHTPPRRTHTHTLMFLSLSLPLSVFSCSSTFVHSTTFSFSISLHIPLPLCVVCLFVPSGFCVSVLWFIVFSRWSCVWLEAGGRQGCVCARVCTCNHCYLCYLLDRWGQRTHTLLDHLIVLYCRLPVPLSVFSWNLWANNLLYIVKT